MSSDDFLENRKSVFVLGTRVDKISFKEAVEVSKSLVKAGGRHFITTPNPEIIVAAKNNPEFRGILNKSDLSIPDGMGLVVLANMFGEKITERVTGVDLLESLAGEAEKEGFKIFLLGSREGVAKKAAIKLRERYPKLKIAGTFSGDAGKEGDKETLKKIGKQQIDILAVAFGPGRQERWINRNLDKLNVHLAIGVGGSLDFISGERKRAPKIIQNIGLEWLFRLLYEPWRLNRQLVLPVFVYLFVIDRLFKGRV